MKVGFIGTGRIAEPMVASIAKRLPEASISVSQRSSAISGELAETYPQVNVFDNQTVVDNSDIVVLCLLAKHAKVELPVLRFKAEQKIISVMADLSLSELEFLILPARDTCITIPLPFISTGNCPLPVYPQSDALQVLFGGENDIMVMPDEPSVAIHFAATAILSTTMNQLKTVSQWLAQATGNQQDAERYVALLLSGHLNAMEKDGNSRFAEAMQELSTEGGLNLQLLDHMQQSGHFNELEHGLNALKVRLLG